MTESERFWAKVHHQCGPAGCWEWTGATTASGYGKFWRGPRRNRRMEMAHRVSWDLVHGAIPDGMQIDHLCFNKRCVNPSHLEPVTPSENTRRAVRAGRRKVPEQTHCKHGHEFTIDNTRFTRQGWRICRKCDEAKKRRYLARLDRDAAGRLVEVQP